jgi:ribosomal protein S6
MRTSRYAGESGDPNLSHTPYTMSRYELLYIIPAKYAENEIQPVMDGITAALTKLGVKTSRNEMVGKLKLAYPVNHVRHGYYILVDLDMEDGNLKDVNEMLRLHTDIIRHHVVVKEKKGKPLFKLASMEDIDRDRVRGQVDRDTRTRQAAAAPAPKKVEVSMEEIDKKLDKIIEGKII